MRYVSAKFEASSFTPNGPDISLSDAVSWLIPYLNSLIIENEMKIDYYLLQSLSGLTPEYN